MLNRPLANRTASRVLASLLIVVVVVAFWQVRSVLLLLLSSIILVVLITTPMRILQRRFRMKRTPALLISLLIFPLFFLVLTQTVLPLLATQLARLSVLLDDGVVRLQEYWGVAERDHAGVAAGWLRLCSGHPGGSAV